MSFIMSSEPLDSPELYAQYHDRGGYHVAWTRVKQMSPVEVRQTVLAAGLRGRGGAAFRRRKMGACCLGGLTHQSIDC